MRYIQGSLMGCLHRRGSDNFHYSSKVKAQIYTKYVLPFYVWKRLDRFNYASIITLCKIIKRYMRHSITGTKAIRSLLFLSRALCEWKRNISRKGTTRTVAKTKTEQSEARKGFSASESARFNPRECAVIVWIHKRATHRIRAFGQCVARWI